MNSRAGSLTTTPADPSHPAEAAGPNGARAAGETGAADASANAHSHSREAGAHEAGAREGATPGRPGLGMFRPSSLRALLTGWLVWPLATLILASAVPTYYLALSAANSAYDSALLDPALAISNHVLVRDNAVSIDLPASALDALRIDARDRIFMQVRDSRGQMAPGSAALPAPPEDIPEGSHIFYDSKLNGEKIRVAALQVPHPAGPVLIQVAETFVKRETMVREMLVATLFSELLVAAAAVGLLWFGIGRGLAPLDRLRREIAARSPKDLRPLSVEDKPDEVQPMIAALNQLLNRLKAAIEGQQRFIANAAHQLRTPLAGLKTHAELARRQPSSVELRPLLEMIAGETGRTAHLVNQLLALARAEPEGSADSNDAPVNLLDVVSRAAQEWVPRAVAKDIDLGFELEDAWTMGEPMLMRELLANLIDNALAYTPASGTVTVRTLKRGHSSVLEVEDDGPGIAPEERARVFERFYRAQGTAGEGCGLGLAIVSEIAQRHGARVEILTAASGKGTLIRTSFGTVRPAPPDQDGEALEGRSPHKD
ncbi:MAG TPA: sensor histidine kinase [Burkholderiales bacterium]|nr:sensor histidine kinase [Burkholderiales bacterium]